MRRLLAAAGSATAAVVALTVAALVAASPASAYWSGTGLGTGAAAAGTLTAPSAVTATTSPGASTVSVGWALPAVVPAGAPVGFVVVRTGVGGPAPACGTNAGSPLPWGTTSCLDTGVGVGTYTYTVKAVLATWGATSAASAPVTVVPDTTAPTMTLSLVSASNAYLGPNGSNYRLYYRSNQPGSFRIAAAVTDTGSGPASATFPVVNNSGWSHAAQTVTAGAGSPPTITYTSTPHTWSAGASTPSTKTITGRDVANNAVNRTVTYRADTTPPSGGALVVNGSTSNTAGTATSTSTTGSWSVSTLTPYTETQSSTRSGLASSTLVRTTAPFAAGVCGSFGAPVTLTGPAPIAQTGVGGTCYRYTLTGIDNVGNTASRATTVRVDTSGPTGGALTVNGTAASALGTTSATTTGSWTIARTEFTDAEAGMTSSILRRQSASITNGVCGTFGTATTITGSPSQTGTARTCYRYTLTGTNAFGATATLTTTVIVGPYVSSLLLANGAGIAGRATQGDTVTVVFSDAITPSSICSAWSGSGDQSLTADNQVTVSLNNSGSSDTLTVSSTACTFNLGSIRLGSTAYTTATATFGGAGASRSTATWTAATRTLVITLGATASTSPATVASSAAVYTPSTAILSTGGLPLGGTFTTPTTPQF